jgi:radical SAM protein with 4Fe4S-binding SPASM domain
MSTHRLTNSHQHKPDNSFFAEHGYLKVPHLVQWMATLRCSMKCEHCLAAGDQSGLADMPLEKVKTLIDEVAELGVNEFLLTGGEPLARDDLVEVIAYLGHKHVNWTLNTAACPTPELRGMIEKHHPAFVAVSLDGPQAVHDGFRGRAGAYEQALESIAFFKSLGVHVCAGTTVTTRNYPYLDETFHLAVGSGADQWGIHLLVPEGKAALRKDLFLSRRQLKHLIRFVAHKRRYFNVQMADEIGYLGLYEPLVRDVPLTCGAGRTQCVVLPDGSVVPCTTLDRSTRAGNLYEQTLQTIWNTGFQELRSWRPQGKCVHCDYAMACKGGCWLQRKAGTECFKDVWHVPGALKTAAGIAICLGSLGAGEQMDAVAEAAQPETRTVRTQVDHYSESVLDAMRLDEAILHYYVEIAAGREVGGDVQPVDANEVGWAFFEDFQEGTLPQDIKERCERVIQALDTEQMSLSLTALCWRAISEPLFDTQDPWAYSDTDKQVIYDTLYAIEQKARALRLEIFVMNLDPYLSRGRITTGLPPAGKAGYSPGYIESYILNKDLNEERWGIGGDPDTRAAAEAYMLAHPCGSYMDLVFSLARNLPWGSELIRFHSGDVVVLSSEIDYGNQGLFTLGLFDMIETTDPVELVFQINAGIKTTQNRREESLLDDTRGDNDINRTVHVQLPGGLRCTYVELIDQVYCQNRDLLARMAVNWLSGKSVRLWDQNYSIITSVNQNQGLLWPVFREIIGHEPDMSSYGRQGLSDLSDLMSPLELDEAIQRLASLKDIDFWMF